MQQLPLNNTKKKMKVQKRYWWKLEMDHYSNYCKWTTVRNIVLNYSKSMRSRNPTDNFQSRNITYFMSSKERGEKQSVFYFLQSFQVSFLKKKDKIYVNLKIFFISSESHPVQCSKKGRKDSLETTIVNQ